MKKYMERLGECKKNDVPSSASNYLSQHITWNERVSRGMNVYHDILDWSGGLPYEVVSEDEVLRVCRKGNLFLRELRLHVKGD